MIELPEPTPISVKESSAQGMIAPFTHATPSTSASTFMAAAAHEKQHAGL